MSNFNSLYQRICEDEIFKASTPEEGLRRKQEYIKIMIQKMVDIGDIVKNPDGSYDAKGDVNLGDIAMNRLPVKFNRVGRDFICNNCNLSTLEGCPKFVGHDFVCSFNQLTNLDHAPKYVAGSFYLRYQRNKKTFTVKEILEVCEVKGEVRVTEGGESRKVST